MKGRNPLTMAQAFDTAWGIVKDDIDPANPFPDDPPGEEGDRFDADKLIGEGKIEPPYNHLDRREDGLYIGGHKVLKGWESYSGWYWFATELNQDGREGLHFGYVQGMHSEWGSFSMREMQPLIDEGRIWELPQNALIHSGRQCECSMCG